MRPKAVGQYQARYNRIDITAETRVPWTNGLRYQVETTSQGNRAAHVIAINYSKSLI